eukprot:SAG31_NODE_11563_length_1017_cov_1.787582_1_plen_152_part_10
MRARGGGGARGRRSVAAALDRSHRSGIARWAGPAGPNLCVHMIVPAAAEAQLAEYCRNGYVVIEDAVPPSALASAQQAYEQTIDKAIQLKHDGAAKFEKRSPSSGVYRFQDPHSPAILHEPLVEALSGPRLMAFVEALYGPTYCMHGIAAFS